ncbi:hypothetical protein [Sphingomonas sp. PWP1-2]|uniref:hypothetical protein n=1 Tax=Sphingomonas sp. PWP1-2 TaxID=2804558 RepID=UPI003CE8D5CC
MMEIDDTENDAECGVTGIANDLDELVDDKTWAWVVEQVWKAVSSPIPMPKTQRALPAVINDLFEEVAA